MAATAIGCELHRSRARARTPATQTTKRHSTTEQLRQQRHAEVHATPPHEPRNLVRTTRLPGQLSATLAAQTVQTSGSRRRPVPTSLEPDSPCLLT